MANTAELMRSCAPLYPSFAIESLASVMLFFFFAYLSILISSKQQLATPARSIARFAYYNVVDWATDTHRVLKRWPNMHEMDLGQRFRYCRRLNATICRISATFALVSITRWLHVNNINGMRYLSYAITCPLMQVELVLMIAPVVPCYRVVAVCTGIITFCMLVGGYCASQFEGLLWTTDWEDIVLDQNLHNLRTKGWLIVPSVCILSFLSFVQIPTLCMLYLCNGGASNPNLPRGYPTLLLITATTWFGFPCWWMMSYEGMSVITDTRVNTIGFVCLNMISKGAYTLHMISMVKRFKKEQALKKPLDGMRERSNSVCTLPDLPGSMPIGALEDPKAADAAERSARVLPTSQSLNWLVEHMKTFDAKGNISEQPQQPAQPDTKVEPQGMGMVMARDASEISNDELIRELARRLGTSKSALASPRMSPRGQARDFQSSLDMQIRLACSQLAIAEDSEEED